MKVVMENKSYDMQFKQMQQERSRMQMQMQFTANSQDSANGKIKASSQGFKT